MKYKNGVLSATFGIIQQLLTLTFGLIVPRLFIRTFGSEMNGLLSSIANIYSYLALVEAGVGTAAIQALYGPIGRDDKKSINQIMTAVASYYNKAGFVYLLGVIAISILYPLTVPTTVPRTTVFLVAILSGTGGVINFWVHGKYTVLLQAEGKKYLMSIMVMVIYVVQNFMKIYMLNMGYDVIAIHVGYFVISLCQMSFFFFYIKKNYRWLYLKEVPNKEALSQSSAVFVQQITGMLCSNTDVLVLTYFARDLKAVSVYTVYLMIYSTIEKLFSTFFGSFHYLLGQKYNTDPVGYMRLHRIYENISMTGSFALYTIAFLLTTPFIRIYTAGITDIQYVDKYLPFLFTLMHLMCSSREACARIINFAGHFKQMQWRTILETSINIISSIILVSYLGIYGVLLGTLISFVYRMNDVILYANKHLLKRSSWNTYKPWLINLAAFGLISFGFSFVDLTADSFIQFFLTAVPVGITVCIVYFVVLLLVSRESVSMLLNAAGKVFQKLRAKKGANI